MNSKRRRWTVRKKPQHSQAQLVLELDRQTPVAKNTRTRRIRSRTSMELAGVHHVAICVDDVDQAIDFYVDVLGGDVKRLVGPTASTDLTVRSTLDLDLQGIAEGVIARRLKAEGRTKKVSQAALVTMAPDGAILAMVGGRDYNESQFNRAVQAKRQPGSLFKTIVYLAAMSDISVSSTNGVSYSIYAANGDGATSPRGGRGNREAA